jgi:hypothetical protein
MPTSTSNMNLQTPTAGESDYPTSVSNSFSAIDAHDHTSGKGVQIPSGGIADGAVTIAKLPAGVLANSSTGRAKMADGFLSADSGGRAKMADGFVTRAKLEAVGQQISSAQASAFSTSSTSYVDVTGVTVGLTTTGRPVIVGLFRAGGGSGFGISLETTDFTQSVSLKILRDAVAIYEDTLVLDQNYGGSPSGSATFSVPCSITLPDVPSAGTYTYKLQVKVNGGGPLIVAQDVKLYAFEL